jgi:replicative DNA helicase
MSEETSANQKSSDSSGDFLASRDSSQQFGLAAANLIPPQNIEVEEAILGGILLDPEAYGRVAELLVPNAFYIPAHGHIYQAAIELHASGLPTDLLNVSNWLADNQLLEKVGGQNKLVQLVERTVSAVNVDSLAVLLMDKYMRRELIQAGNVVGQLGYDMGKPLEQVLDQAEQKVLNVTQVRPQSGLTAVGEIILQTYQDITARNQDLTPPGLTCDFADLDAMTGGFQRSDLIIIAGRPSMGKTAISLNIAYNMALIHQLPILVFSLEMSKEQLVQRMLAGEARIDSNRLRAGRISQNEWEQVHAAIDKIADLPIYIDDTANMMVMQMRSQARRLQAETGKPLGLIMLDYLQLMEGSSDNRVQEISKITRSLKGLARELNVPIIALSQLSRSVEARNNKRPMMSDLRECVTGDTLVLLADGRRVPIRQLVGQKPQVLAMDEKEKITVSESDRVWSVGVKPVFELKLASGRALKATAKHRIYSAQGWQELQELTVGSRVAIARYIPEPQKPIKWPEHQIILLAHLMGDGSYLKGQPLRYTTASEENSEIVTNAALPFGVQVNRHPGKGNWHQLVFSGNGNRWKPAGINLWLRELGVFDQRSHEKHIPDGIFQLPNHQVAKFIAHLWATDGTYHVPKSGGSATKISLSTCSLQLAQGVALLLLKFSIVARIRTVYYKEYRPVYLVDISGKTMQSTFLEAIGAVGCKVLDAKRFSLKLETIEANPNQDTLPIEVFQVIRNKMSEQNITTRQMSAMRNTAYGGSSHFKFAPSRATVLDYASLLGSDELSQKASSDLFWDEVIEVSAAGEEEVFDLTVPGEESWLADGIVSHNSGSIEQDADLVIMLYRDAYYNPDTPDRDITELIVTKHRNGPTGVVKLVFDPGLTKFKNLAQPR